MLVKASRPSAPEAWTPRGDGSVDDRDRLGQNGAREIEIFEPMRRRSRGEQMRAHLGKQMRGHFDAARARER